MICPKKLNNLEYQWIKTNKLFGLDQKSQIKMHKYIVFYLLLSNIAEKTSKDGFKMTKNVSKCPLFDICWHYLNLKKVFVWHAKRIGWPDSIRLVHRIPKQIPNFLNNFFHTNNVPKLTRKYNFLNCCQLNNSKIYNTFSQRGNESYPDVIYTHRLAVTF